ncbi:MAG TPA: hypothetical protein VNO70_20275, partial [Blastocatellia bacterium]|nr:hypothetical protein [Blastocatellia bacterium]
MTRPERLLRRFRLRGATAGILLICLLAGTATSNQEHQSERRAGTLPDLSGLAWIDGDRFLAVHDAKNPEENQFPRVSIVRLPRSLDGPAWEPLEVDWPPPLGLSSDLESIARIPGTQSYLLVESGEGKHNGRRYLRVFQVELHDRALKIVSFTELPAQVKNIEGAAVARLGERLVFIFAERAGDHRGTIINWADLRLQPLRIGDARQVRFAPAGFVGPGLRPVS